MHSAGPEVREQQPVLSKLCKCERAPSQLARHPPEKLHSTCSRCGTTQFARIRCCNYVVFTSQPRQHRAATAPCQCTTSMATQLHGDSTIDANSATRSACSCCAAAAQQRPATVPQAWAPSCRAQCILAQHAQRAKVAAPRRRRAATASATDHPAARCYANSIMRLARCCCDGVAPNLSMGT